MQTSTTEPGVKHDPQDGQRAQLDAPSRGENGGEEQGQQKGLGVGEDLPVRQVELAVAVDRHVAFECEEEEGRVARRDGLSPRGGFLPLGGFFVVFVFFGDEVAVAVAVTEVVAVVVVVVWVLIDIDDHVTAAIFARKTKTSLVFDAVALGRTLLSAV